MFSLITTGSCLAIPQETRSPIRASFPHPSLVKDISKLSPSPSLPAPPLLPDPRGLEHLPSHGGLRLTPLTLCTAFPWLLASFLNHSVISSLWGHLPLLMTDTLRAFCPCTPSPHRPSWQSPFYICPTNKNLLWVKAQALRSNSLEAWEVALFIGPSRSQEGTKTSHVESYLLPIRKNCPQSVYNLPRQMPYITPSLFFSSSSYMERKLGPKGRTAHLQSNRAGSLLIYTLPAPISVPSTWKALTTYFLITHRMN